MSISPRLKLFTVCIGAAFAQMASVPALADSGVGVDTVLGNAGNPGYPAGPVSLEANSSYGRHTPTGQLYGTPYALSEEGEKNSSGWTSTKNLEIGIMGGDNNKKNALFRMYKDPANSLYINNFGVEAEQADSASFLSLSGGGVTNSDQYYGMSFGRYNDWKVKAFYNETPHVFTTSYRNIFNGVGTGTLTLKPGLVAGGTGAGAVAPGITPADAASVIAVANANAGTELSIVRKKGGARLDMNVSDESKVYASYTNEHRVGSRPFGMVAGIGGGGGQATPFIEAPESIDYNTHDLLAGIQYADGLNSLNLSLSASIFRNHIGTETIQIPFGNFAVAADGVAARALTQGRFDLVPDNEAYNATAEYERQLPDWMKGRFTATVSVGTNRQNDALIPPSVNAIPGIAAMNVTNTAAGAWNTTGALSQLTAGAKINNQLIDLGLALKPQDDLDVKAKLRHYATQNSTHYLACNPNAIYADNSPAAGITPGGINALGCNGVWGRILNDGAAVSLFQPNIAAPSTAIYIQNTPYDSRQTNYGISADYKLDKYSSLNAALEREDVKRSFRERDKTWEDKLKLGFVNSGYEKGTLRVSYEYDTRRGSQYTTTQFRTTQMSGALYPALPVAVVLPAAAYQTTALYETRRMDVADRDQGILNARFNYLVTPELDAGASMQVKRGKFPDALLGTSKRNQDTLNLDLTYQPSTELSASAFYTYQTGNYNMASATAGIAAGTLAVAPNPAGWALTCTDLNNPGGCALPYNRLARFDINTKDRNDILGLSMLYDFGKTKLQADFTHTRGVTTTGYTYGPTAALQAGPLTGFGMPDMNFDQNTLDLKLLIPQTKDLSIKLLYHFEEGRITDWHYTTIQASPAASLTAAGVTDGFVFDMGPQNYRSHAVGVMLDFKL